MRILFFSSLLLHITLLAPCSAEVGERGFSVVATTTMVADLCRAIGGSRVTVTSLVEAGVDPHSFRLGFRQISLLREADVIVGNGLGLEGLMDEALTAVADSKPVLRLSEGVPSRLLLPGDDKGTLSDPHFWGDVSLWASAAEYLAREFATFDVKHGPEHLIRGGEYRGRLMQLHSEIAERLKALPPNRKILITPHRAFAYFAAAYGLEALSLLGVNPTLETGEPDMKEFVSLIRRRKAQVFFPESIISRDVLDATVTHCVEKGHSLVVGGALLSDALGLADSPTGTYVGMMRANVETIVESEQTIPHGVK